ncbi:MAG: hypothetical protein IJQ10_02235 [Clostridia bacterium]|nr:hypothetical protein [Clostridia bacterium]
MSRSKNKIAVTTLLSALACSATASAAGQNGKDIKSVESQTSFSTRKSSESSIKSARSFEGARSWFQKIPTWAKITALVSAPILTAEIYNEIAGAVSGKEWYLGKYSFVNLARGKGEDENPESNKNPNIVEKSENQDETSNNIDDKSKDNTCLGAAPSSLTKEQEEQLGVVLGQFKEAGKASPGLYEKFEEKLKDALIKIIKGKFKIVADEGVKSYAEKFINFVKGKNGDYGVKIFKSDDSFVIKVSDNELAKRFAISINNDKLQIGENFILLT